MYFWKFACITGSSFAIFLSWLAPRLPILTTIPILALSNDEGTNVLDCDACDVGLWAVLSLRIEGEERVIAYGSRLLSTAERNFCVTRKALLAIVYFTKSYR